MKFQITRRYPGDIKSLIIGFAAALGTPIMPHATDAEAGSLASGNFSGFLDRAVADPTDQQKLLNSLLAPNGALPIEVGEYAPVALADEFEAESTDYLVESGTGALASNTAIGTKITPYEGKWRITQNGEIPYFRIIGYPTKEESTSSFRIRAEAIR